MGSTILQLYLLIIMTLFWTAGSHSLYDYTTFEEAKETLIFYSDLDHWVADKNMTFLGLVQLSTQVSSCTNAMAKPIWGLLSLGEGYIYTEIFLPGIPIEAKMEIVADEESSLEINYINTNCISNYLPVTCDVVSFLQIGFNKLRFKVFGDKWIDYLCYALNVTVTLAL